MTRHHAFDELEKLDAIPKDNVTKKTQLIIIGKYVGEAKISKAKKFNTPCIGESEFLKLIGSKERIHVLICRASPSDDVTYLDQRNELNDFILARFKGALWLESTGDRFALEGLEADIDLIQSNMNEILIMIKKQYPDLFKNVNKIICEKHLFNDVPLGLDVIYTSRPH